MSHAPAPPRSKSWLAAPAAFAAYLLAARAGHWMAPAGTHVSAFWPAAGLALWVAWRFGTAGLVGVATAAFANALWTATATTSGTWLALAPGAAGVALGNTLQAWLGAWSARKVLRTNPLFSRTSEVAGFALTNAAACATAALIGAGSLAATGTVEPSWTAGTTWYLGDLVGVLTVAPALFSWSERGRAPWTGEERSGFALLVAVMLSVVGWTMRPGAALLAGLPAAHVLLVPCFLWGAVRLGVRGVALLLPLASLASSLALASRAELAQARDSQLLLQLFLGVIGVTGLMLAAALESLAAVRDLLEQRVQARTADLESANEKLRAEVLERAHVQAALRASEALFKATVEHLPFDFSACDTEGRCLLQNRISVERWGDVVGRRIDELGLPAETLARWRGRHARALRGEVVLDVDESVSDGQQRTYESVVAPVLEGERVRFVLCVRIDATERRELHARLLQSQKVESLGRLAGGVAHDFNNLLTAILGYSETAFLQIGPEHAAAADLGEIRRAAMRASELTRQLLLFSRKHPPRPREVALDELVLGFERMLRRVIGEHIELVVDARSDAALVLADPGQLEQVLLNLAVNARDAMPQGGTLTISTARTTLSERPSGLARAVPPGEYVRLRVRDTGLGIPVGLQERIFEPFFSTKPEGTGLGLATVYAIVQQAGGHVRFESAPERGSTFVILLPLHDAAREPRPAPALPREAVRGGSETLLLAEDEPLVRRVAAAELRSRGYTVLAAANGEEALRLARAHPGPIEALVTDLVMPRMGGEELAAELRRERAGLRVLFASGYASELGRRAPREEPETDFLAKPFGPEELSRAVRALLDRGRIAPEPSRGA